MKPFPVILFQIFLTLSLQIPSCLWICHLYIGNCPVCESEVNFPSELQKWISLPPGCFQHNLACLLTWVFLQTPPLSPTKEVSMALNLQEHHHLHVLVSVLPLLKPPWLKQFHNLSTLITSSCPFPLSDSSIYPIHWCQGNPPKMSTYLNLMYTQSYIKCPNNTSQWLKCHIEIPSICSSLRFQGGLYAPKSRGRGCELLIFPVTKLSFPSLHLT